MQISCQRFGCQKAVEVCYWSCKHRKGCKDWRQALEGEPGEEAIQARLESASARSGRSFDVATLVLPGRKRKGKKEAARETVREEVRPVVKKEVRKEVRKEVQKEVRKKEASRIEGSGKEAVRAGEGGRRRMARAATPDMEETEVKRPAVEPVDDWNADARSAQATKKPRAKQAGAKRNKPATSGPVYLLLSPNGKYRELREDELAAEAAHLLRDPSLRLVKGQFLIPQITFRSADE